MTLYEMSWTTKNGERIEGQLFTVESVSHQLKCIEEWGGYNVILKEVNNNQPKGATI